jgi:hypothetical protein
MTSDSLSGITNLEATATIYSSVSGEPLAEYSLRQVLMQFFMYPLISGSGYNKEQRLFAEIHQSKSPGATVSVVIPNTSEVERMMLNLNKNFPTVLTDILKSQGLPAPFIIDIIKAGVCQVQVANMCNCKYDAKTKTLTTDLEDKMEKARSTMANASWFKDSFDLSTLPKKGKKTATPPEMMFDIDGTRSLKTIHEKSKTLTFNLESGSSHNSSSSNSSGSSLQSKGSKGSISLELMSLNSHSRAISDEVSTTSSKKKKRSHPLATVRNNVPASSDEVDGSAQGATLSE